MISGFNTDDLRGMLTSQDSEEIIQALQYLISNPDYVNEYNLGGSISKLVQSTDIGVRFWAKKLCNGLKVYETERSNAQVAAIPKDLPVDILIQKLKSVASTYVSLDVIKKLCESRNPEAQDFLKTYLASCTDTTQISYLTKNIGVFFPSEENLHFLMPFLRHEDDRVVANTIEGIQAIGSHKGVVVISQLLEHKCNRIRTNAALSLGKFDAEQAFAVVSKMLAPESGAHFRISACHAIKVLRDLRFLDQLESALLNETTFSAALEAIAAIGGQASIDLLTKNYAKIPSGRQPQVDSVAAELSRLEENPLEKLKERISSSKACSRASIVIEEYNNKLNKKLSSINDSYKSTAARIAQYRFHIAGAIILLLLTSIWVSLPSKSSAVKLPEKATSEKDTDRSSSEIQKNDASVTPGEANNASRVEKVTKIFPTNQFTPDMIKIFSEKRQLTLQEIQSFVETGADVNARYKGMTPLMLAAGSQNSDVIMALIKAGAEVNARDVDGWTALTAAAKYNKDPEVFKTLIKAGADINIKYKGLPPLITAAFEQNPEVITALIKAGADVNANFKEATPLIAAAFSNENPEVVKTLIKAGADVNYRYNGSTALVAAISNKNPEVAITLIKAGADVNACDDKGRSTMQAFVVGCQNPNVIAAMTKAGADVNASFGGLSLLMYAAKLNPNPEVITTLIKAGADVNAKKDSGATVLMEAVITNHNSGVITALIEAGADVNARYDIGLTVLMEAAAFNQNPEVIKTLIKAGADVNACDENDWSALMRAAFNNQNPEVVKALIKANQDAGMPDDRPAETLFLAAGDNKNPEVITAIIRAMGVDVDAHDRTGMTALMKAAESNQNPDVVTRLLKHGANAKLRSRDGKTAFDYAEKNKHLAGTDAYLQLLQAQ